MSLQIQHPPEETGQRIADAIREALDDAEVTVNGLGGHFQIRVVSKHFEGKNTLAKQRLVYKAIAPLMAGEQAPVHAVDRLETLTPDTRGRP